MSNPISAPKPTLKRKNIFSVRLTSVERDAIKGLAQLMNVSPSHLVRPFLMQAVNRYSTRKGGTVN